MILPLWHLGAAMLSGGVLYWIHKRGATSSREDMAEDLSAPCEYDIASALGWPYFFGKGSPNTPWASGINGVDCSGFVQMALVRLNLLSASAPDRGAATLAADSNPIPIGSQQIGDIAYYPGHVMIVCGPPNADGHSPVMGASGGTSTTLGNDPNAKVKLFSSGLYNRDFITYMRLK